MRSRALLRWLLAGGRFLEVVGVCCVQLVPWKTGFGYWYSSLRFLDLTYYVSSIGNWNCVGMCWGFVLVKFGDVVVLKWYAGLVHRRVFTRISELFYLTFIIVVTPAATIITIIWYLLLLSLFNFLIFIIILGGSPRESRREKKEKKKNKKNRKTKKGRRRQSRRTEATCVARFA